MNAYYRISKAFTNACCLPLDTCSKYVIFSDCHRGTGKANDNFLKNELLYLAALKHYFQKDFTYLELGDGDELWENRSFEDIKQMHPDSFELMSKFHQYGRFYAVYGNHDIVKKRTNFSEKCCRNYYCEHELCQKPLFPYIAFYSGIILKDKEKKKDIYLTHGHQADFLNCTLWPLSRFFVRYIWRPLELLGVPDPTSAAKNHRRKKKSEQRLTAWAKEHHHILITGHTHHPMIGTASSPYFNTGSCISPSGITCIEIENRCISLAKWSLKIDNNQAVYAGKSVLGNTICIDNY